MFLCNVGRRGAYVRCKGHRLLFRTYTASNRPRGSRKEESRERFRELDRYLISRVVDVGRVATVTASGKVLSYRALVVAGNGSGAGGFGIGRGDSAQVALERALVKATKDMVPLDISPEGTLYHDLIGKHNSTLVLLRSVNKRNGIKASRIVAGVCEVMGLKHVVSKIVTRGRNPYSIVMATFNALGKHSHPDDLALMRGRKVERLYK